MKVTGLSKLHWEFQFCNKGWGQTLRLRIQAELQIQAFALLTLDELARPRSQPC